MTRHPANDRCVRTVRKTRKRMFKSARPDHRTSPNQKTRLAADGRRWTPTVSIRTARVTAGGQQSDTSGTTFDYCTRPIRGASQSGRPRGARRKEDRQVTSATPRQVTAMPARESALGTTPNIASSSADREDRREVEQARDAGRLPAAHQRVQRAHREYRGADHEEQDRAGQLPTTSRTAHVLECPCERRQHRRWWRRTARPPRCAGPRAGRTRAGRGCRPSRPRATP